MPFTKNKNLKSIILIYLILLFPACAYVSYKKAVKSDDIEVLRSYLQKYPTGKYSPYIQDRIIEQEWEMVSNQNTRSGYENFIQNLPCNKYTKYAYDAIWRTDYKKANNLNTIEAYRSFISSMNKYNPPDYLVRDYVKYINNAKENIDYLNATDINTIEKYLDFLNKYKDDQYCIRIRNSLITLLNVKYSKEIDINSLDNLYDFKNKYQDYISDSLRSVLLKDINVKERVNFDYYPLNYGNSWSYIFGKIPNKQIVKVKDYVKDKNLYFIENIMSLEGLPSYSNAEVIEKRNNEILLTMTGSDLYGISIKDVIPPEPLLKYPLELNKKWIHENSDGRTIYKVMDYCNLKVKAGIFSDVVVIKRRIEILKNNKYELFGETYRYYAPDVGLILESFTDDTVKMKMDYLSKMLELSSWKCFK